MKSLEEDVSPSVNTRWLALAAMAIMCWLLICIVFFLLAPSRIVPVIFHNLHIEHFAAFYLLSILFAVAFPSLSLKRIALGVASGASVIALIRLSNLVGRRFSVEDLLCDVAGIAAALGPILVGRFRYLSTR